MIAALVPIATWDHVIGYRSTPGFFGLSGMVTELARLDVRLVLATVLALGAVSAIGWIWLRLSREATVPPNRMFLLVAATSMIVVVWLAEAFDRLTPFDARSRYDTLFTIGVACLVVWLCYRLWREQPLPPERLFLLVAVIFMLVVAFGPGYGSHYAYWFVPALVATYVLLDDRWRRLLRAAFVVAGLTYAVEYAFVLFLGEYATAISGRSDWATDVSEYLSVSYRLVLFRVPLFVVYLVLIGEGLARLAAPRTDEERAAHTSPA